MSSPNRLAPIAIFAYRRASHLEQALDALEACPEFSVSSVTIYSDGPKTEAARADVEAVRTLLASRKRANITVVEASANNGLANSVIAGVTEQCARHGRVIVIEDDLVVSPVALRWLNEGLERYRSDARIWQVGAHQFPVPEFVSRPDGMFLRLSSSWGWGTWKRAWDQFDPAASGWQALRCDPQLKHRFDLDASYPYAQMMEQQMAGQVDSWAIRWWWTIFKADGLGLFPSRSLISNIGRDGSATHSASWLRRLMRPELTEDVENCMPLFPSEVAADETAQVALQSFLRAHNRPSWKQRLKSMVQ